MRTDRETDTTKLMVAFRNFANVPKTALTMNAMYSVLSKKKKFSTKTVKLNT